MPRIQGVYQISNTLTSDIYIGSSVDTDRRWSDHRRELNTKIHKNASLQAAWNDFGVAAFQLTILEVVTTAEDLSIREQHYLDFLVPSYNEDAKAIRAPYRTCRSDEADEKRFWSKIDQTGQGCWLWQGACFSQGYGCFKANGKMHKAHRISYAYANGPIPQGLVVCHSCDNPPCVRPDHLFLGTYKDNMQDASRKGRMATGDRSGPRLYPERLARGDTHCSHLHPEQYRGELNGRAVLYRQQVEDIRTRYATGKISQLALSEEFHVAQTTISAIVRGLLWKE